MPPIHEIRPIQLASTRFAPAQERTIARNLSFPPSVLRMEALADLADAPTSVTPDLHENAVCSDGDSEDPQVPAEPQRLASISSIFWLPDSVQNSLSSQQCPPIPVSELYTLSNKANGMSKSQ